jgi:hypothetical protein
MKDRYSWAEPPPFSITHPDDVERIPIRDANHEAYKVLGTTAIWNKYVNLGYYLIDDCMQFQKIWKSTAKGSVTHRNKLIWQSFHFHRMHQIPTPEKLTLSASNTARPYLKEKDPDFILATDIEYEEKEFFTACKSSTTNLNRTNSSDDSSEDAEQEWTEVITKKAWKKTPPPSPTSTPEQTLLMYDNMMDLSEDTIDEVKQASKLPVFVSTPERMKTNNSHNLDTTTTIDIQGSKLACLPRALKKLKS